MSRLLLCLLLALSPVALLAGCHSRAYHPAPSLAHVLPPLQPVARDLDRQLSVAGRISLAGAGLGTVAAVVLFLEVHMFVRLALGIAAGSALSWFLVSFMRLSVPLLAMLVPWILAGALLSAGLAGWYLWWKPRHMPPSPPSPPTPPAPPPTP